jgi:hypothetical protein
MPIVVDEVVISVDLSNDGGAGAPATGGGGAADQDRQAIVAEAVERVLEILAEREER